MEVEYLSAFWELSTDRQIGMAPGPVPRSSIEDWCDRAELEPDERELARFLFRAMDKAYADFHDGKPGRHNQPVVSSRPFSMSLFDALFSTAKTKPTKPAR